MNQSFDPLTFIPSSAAIRRRLVQAQDVVKRLHILLRLANRLESTTQQSEGARTAKRSSRRREATNAG